MFLSLISFEQILSTAGALAGLVIVTLSTFPDFFVLLSSPELCFCCPLSFLVPLLEKEDETGIGGDRGEAV